MTRRLEPPSADRADWTFGYLVYWHFFVFGTRPSADPGQPHGRTWIRDQPPKAVGITARTLRNWIADKNRPAEQEFARLLKALFGDKPEFEPWRQELIAARLRPCKASEPVQEFIEGAFEFISWVWEELIASIYRDARQRRPAGRAVAIIPGLFSLLKREKASAVAVPDDGSENYAAGSIDETVQAKNASAILRQNLGSLPQKRETGASQKGKTEDGSPTGHKPSRSGWSRPETIDVTYVDVRTAPADPPRRRAGVRFPRGSLSLGLATALALVLLLDWLPIAPLMPNVPKTGPGQPDETKLAGPKEQGLQDRHDRPAVPKTPTVPVPTPAEPPRTEVNPTVPASPPSVDTPWRAEQDAEAQRLAHRTPEQVEAEKIAAWDRQVQVAIDAGFTIHPSSTLTGEKLDRASAQTAADCARSCTGPNCAGWVFEEQRSLCDRYRPPVQLKPYGLGYTAGVRVSRASSEDTVVPTAASSALPIEKVQATAAGPNGPDGITRCANGSFKAPGFDLVCDRNLYGGGMLGRYPQRSPAGSFNECADLCRSISRCVVFTWEENGRPPRICNIFGPGGFQSNAAGGQISGFRCGGITDKRQLQQTGHISCPAP